MLAVSLSAFGDVPSFERVKAAHESSDRIVLDRYARPLHEARVERVGRRGEWISLGGVSPALRAAVIAAEDKRFYSHRGVDWKAMVWAALRVRGASTITMQLAGYLNPGLRPKRGRRDWLQKWRQVSDAREIERGWTKDQILEAYLNLVTFRGELRGVAAASRGLFDKEPHGLDAVESALLAALIRSPNAKETGVARRACALAKRTGADCAAIGALAATVLGRPYFIRPRVALAPQAARELIRRGKRVATIDADLQRFVAESLAAHLLPLRTRNVRDGAVIVVHNASGDILAYVGNSGAGSSAPHVDGAKARRQAGSTLKPFVYGVALERRLLTAASLLDDSPLEVASPRGVYRPANYDNRFHGLVPLRLALGSSLNIPAVRTLMLAGEERVLERMGELGFGGLLSSDDYGPSLALGSADVSLLELVNAYRALANGGRWSPLRLSADDPRPVARAVYGGDVAFLLGDILSDRASRSLTFGLESPLATRFWTAVKTGTSKDMRDNWCVGYSDTYTVGVWAGNFSGEPMWNVSGVSGAAPVWIEVMNRLHAAVPSRRPSPPAGVVRRGDEYFLAGSEPRAVEPSGARVATRIAYPTPGLILALDPDIPLSRQRVFFETEGEAAGARWVLDGKPAAAEWTPATGRHRLRLVGADGALLDRVAFEVRGSWSVAVD